MYDNDELDRIKRETSILSVAERYGVYAERKGKTCMALCPFHDDHNPSGYIYTNRRGQERWHCFPCGLDGSSVDFVMGLYDIGPLEAATRIAEHFGWSPSQKPEQRLKTRKPLKLRPSRRTSDARR